VEFQVEPPFANPELDLFATHPLLWGSKKAAVSGNTTAAPILRQALFFLDRKRKREREREILFYFISLGLNQTALCGGT
jgi:hypothetical protein